MVKSPTRKDKILDFFSTDLYHLYQLPIITQPLQPDDPSKAKASDHSIPVIIPKSSNNEIKSKRSVIKFLDFIFGKFEPYVYKHQQ